jgi:cytochrome c553
MVWLRFLMLKVSSAACVHFHRLALVVPAILLSNTSSLAQNARSPFTQAQVTAGHASYFTYCSQCHGESLLGGGEVPPLTGPSFAHDVSKETIRDFYRYVSTAMPQGLEGDLKPEQYSDIITFLLAANGAKPGSMPFDKNSSEVIGSIANGVEVPAVVNAPVPQGGAAQ